jgi:hypothetical protein
MGETPDSVYERGESAGRRDARLDGHDVHFAAINGQLAKFANEVHALTLSVQRLGDQLIADAATVLATAAALKDAESARREREAAKREQKDRAWSPWARLAAAVGALAGLSTVVGVLYALFHRG